MFITLCQAVLLCVLYVCVCVGQYDFLNQNVPDMLNINSSVGNLDLMFLF